MGIYRLTYYSNDYRVKGYLAIPDTLENPDTPVVPNSLRMAPDRIQNWLAKYDAERIDSNLEPLIPERYQTSAPFPAVIYCRGGIGKVGAVKLNWVELFARQGFVVFAPCYRGNEGGEGRDEFGGSDREDVHSAFRLLQELPLVRKDQISVLGFSRGSINAALTAAEVPGVHRMISWGGVSDLAKTYEQRVDLRRMLKRVVGGTPWRVPEEYRRRSPLAWVERIACPVLVVHGESDVQVDISHGRELYHALKEAGAVTDFQFYPGYGHHLPSPVHEAVVERMFDWLRQ